MNFKRVFALFIIFSVSFHGYSQENKTINGIQDIRKKAYAFTNATIHVDYKTTYENATLLIKEGKVIAVGVETPIPKNYVKIDLKGKHIYPSFIDLYSDYGVPKVKIKPFSWNAPEIITNPEKGPYNTLSCVTPEYQSITSFKNDEKKADQLRKEGFGIVLSHKRDGLIRGTGVLASTANLDPHLTVLRPKVAQHFSFSKGTSQQMYPFSTMGFIAAIRQTYLDASWYTQFKNKEVKKPFTDISLEAFNAQQNIPQIFETKNWLEILRANKISKEFNKDYIYKTAGDSYQYLKEISSLKIPLIVPINYVKAPAITSPLQSENITLEQLMSWELAPTNLSRLEAALVTFSITADGLEPKTFHKHLLQAIDQGLSKKAALKALTITPAVMIGMSKELGSLTKGKRANFFITDKDYFEKDVNIKSHIIQGIMHGNAFQNDLDIKGTYQIVLDQKEYKLEVTDAPKGLKGKIYFSDSLTQNVKIKKIEEQLSFSFKGSDKSSDEQYFLSGWLEGSSIVGKGYFADGPFFEWTATLVSDSNDVKKTKQKKPKTLISTVNFPLGTYGTKAAPISEKILIKNATVWTNTEKGILENADVLIVNGKISAVGTGLQSKDARVIEGKGFHVTPGIVDEHSHIAATSINDLAVNSSMVRIGDVLDPTDINIFRQLSGGVTTSQILHGSANPIGGQSALIKLRWGLGPEELKIKNAPQFIKFALGENVKRSRSAVSIRYPQTRMGVEQVYDDAFSSALAYEKKWKDYYALPSKTRAAAIRPRKDLVMEAMIEVLNMKRYISCHSYVQSEINMLMHLTEKYNFHVNTFTHILEGYKVADKMKDHGASGSTFSDWWAYKWEVRYAIPYNAALMHREGVNVAINSDDAEMARRLNQEAAKSVKYGDMDEEDVLKMVTLNPAKMLHLENRIGSLKSGMDADVVLWSDHPLSVYAKALKTIIDGKVYFDREKSEALLKKQESIRKKLILKAQSDSAPKAAPKAPKPKFHCDHLNGIQTHHAH